MSKSVAVGLLALILLATYSNHFQNSFHFDDAHTIVNNAAIRELKNIPIFFKDARSFSSLPSNQSYRPLVSTLLAIDYRLSGLDPFWYHLLSLALFICAYSTARVCDLLFARQRVDHVCRGFALRTTSGKR